MAFPRRFRSKPDLKTQKMLSREKLREKKKKIRELDGA